jgi:hypothetical protein
MVRSVSQRIKACHSVTICSLPLSRRSNLPPGINCRYLAVTPLQALWASSLSPTPCVPVFVSHYAALPRRPTPNTPEATRRPFFHSFDLITFLNHQISTLFVLDELFSPSLIRLGQGFRLRIERAFLVGRLPSLHPPAETRTAFPPEDISVFCHSRLFSDHAISLL